MRWTRMVVTATLALAAVSTSGGRSDAGDLLDRLFRKRPKEATSHPAARSSNPTAPALGSPPPLAANVVIPPLTPVQYEAEIVARSPSAQSGSETQPIGVLTLAEALRIAEARQPQLVAAAAAIDAAAGRYRQARTYPNPSADVRGESMNPNTEIVAGFSQPINIGQRRQRAIEAGARDIEARDREFDALRARVFLEVKQSFYEVIALQQLLALAREQERNANSLLEKMQARFKEGDIAERDVLRAEVDLSNVRILAENLERELTEARKTLATRMGVATTSIVRCEGELKLPARFASEEELTDQLLSGHPDLKAALAEVQFRSALTAQACAERTPDVTLNVLYRRVTVVDRDAVDVGIVLPLPLFDRRQGRIAEAAADARRAQARYAATENDLVGQLRRAYESLLTYYRQVEAYQTNILPKTDRSLELVRTAYEGGEVSILELLDAQRQSNASHAAYLGVLSNLVQRWSEVEYLVQSQPSGVADRGQP